MTSGFLIHPKQIPKEVVFAAPPVTTCFHKPPPSTHGPENTACSPRLRASAAASQPQNGPRPRLPLNISLLLLPFSELLYKMLWVCPSNRAQVTRGEGLPSCHLYVPRPVRKGKEREEWRWSLRCDADTFPRPQMTAFHRPAEDWALGLLTP